MAINEIELASFLTAEQKRETSNNYAASRSLNLLTILVIPFSTEEAIPLFEPDGRNLTYSWWNPIILCRGNGVSMVSDFVEGGSLVAVVERYASGVKEYLRNKKGNLGE